jgi:putative restriction endonuclease
MEAGVVLDRFSELGVWERAGVRAPYKPLLLLHALARYQAGGERLISFSDLDERMQGIFRAFGPPRRRYGTNHPFWYLQTDGVWEVESADELRMRKGKSREPTRTALREAHARGGLAPELYAALRNDPALLQRVASHLLTAPFPETLHEEILSAVGLQFAVTRAVRNALFREHVLMAYEYRCAVCGFDARLVDSLIAIEAAHIMWHQGRNLATADSARTRRGRPPPRPGSPAIRRRPVGSARGDGRPQPIREAPEAAESPPLTPPWASTSSARPRRAPPRRLDLIATERASSSPASLAIRAGWGSVVTLLIRSQLQLEALSATWDEMTPLIRRPSRAH